MKEEPIRAAVYYQEMKAGVLTKTEKGYDFEYGPDYLSNPDAKPISLSLPLRQEKYESTRLFSFFDGLLPEGWLLDIISSTAKIDKKNKFQLLLLTGKDPIGAVSILPDEEVSG